MVDGIHLFNFWFTVKLQLEYFYLIIIFEVQADHYTTGLCAKAMLSWLNFPPTSAQQTADRDVQPSAILPGQNHFPLRLRPDPNITRSRRGCFTGISPEKSPSLLLSKQLMGLSR
jgi:hypothetical protein